MIASTYVVRTMLLNDENLISRNKNDDYNDTKNSRWKQ